MQRTSCSFAHVPAGAIHDLGSGLLLLDGQPCTHNKRRVSGGCHRVSQIEFWEFRRVGPGRTWPEDSQTRHMTRQVAATGAGSGALASACTGLALFLATGVLSSNDISER